MSWAAALLVCTATAIAATAGGALATAAMQCPRTPAPIHAQCQMEVLANAPCAQVYNEVLLRINGARGWTDPHNNGTYSVLSTAPDAISGQRLTGKAPHYKDLFDFTFTDADNGKRCALTACSVAQTTSVVDFSTNYCNLHNLYCGSRSRCTPVDHDFDSAETYTFCNQRADVCIVT